MLCFLIESLNALGWKGSESSSGSTPPVFSERRETPPAFAAADATVAGPFAPATRLGAARNHRERRRKKEPLGKGWGRDKANGLCQRLAREVPHEVAEPGFKKEMLKTLKCSQWSFDPSFASLAARDIWYR